MNDRVIELIGAKKIAERFQAKVESLTSSARLGKPLGMESKAGFHLGKK